MTAWYNEPDPFAAGWLRELIAAGEIAAGDVDERSIEDVSPDDLRPYAQCHFFAGIGVWSYALRRAGWPDDGPVWTGSCPCQPFSSAGKGAGFADERHLWPAWHWLIAQRRPGLVLGEQVASKDGLAWLDLVQADMEAEGFAFGALDLCAAGFGAPHIRQRSYWVADAGSSGFRRRHEHVDDIGPSTKIRGKISQQRIRPNNGTDCAISRLAYDDSKQFAQRTQSNRGSLQSEQQTSRRLDVAGRGQLDFPCPINGFWGDADWLGCTDAKWRPVEPGAFPLADGAANRVGRLRGYGNAIVAPVAQAFVEEVMEWQRAKELLSD